MQRECRSPGVKRHDVKSLNLNLSRKLLSAPIANTAALADVFASYRDLGTWGNNGAAGRAPESISFSSEIR